MACTSHQDGLPSGAALSAPHHQGRVQSGATESAPQHQRQLQSSAAQPALHHQEKTQREVITRLSHEVVEDLIESIPYYDQMISSTI